MNRTTSNPFTHEWHASDLRLSSNMITFICNIKLRDDGVFGNSCEPLY